MIYSTFDESERQENIFVAPKKDSKTTEDSFLRIQYLNDADVSLLHSEGRLTCYIVILPKHCLHEIFLNLRIYQRYINF